MSHGKIVQRKISWARIDAYNARLHDDDMR